MGIRYSRLGETLTSTEAFFGWMPIRAMPLSWRPIHRADGSTRPLGRRIERVSTSSGACLAGGKWPSFQRDPAAGAEKDLVRRFHLGNLVPNNISPDGRYIFTASADSSTNTRFMLLIPLDGGAPRVIMPVAAETKPEDLKNYDKGQAVGGVYWMPDGRSFLVSKRSTGKKEGEVWQVPVDGSAPHKLDWTLIDDKFSWGALRPGGRELAMTIWEPAPKPSLEIWVLNHFLPARPAK